MSSSIRLSDKLVRQAEAEGRLFHRSTPRQIEFWADLGKKMEAWLPPADLIALCQGTARLRVERLEPVPVDADEVFSRVEEERAQFPVTQAAVCYEASSTHPGLVDRVGPDGRTPGRFVNGEFVPA